MEKIVLYSNEQQNKSINFDCEEIKYDCEEINLFKNMLKSIVNNLIEYETSYL